MKKVSMACAAFILVFLNVQLFSGSIIQNNTAKGQYIPDTNTTAANLKTLPVSMNKHDYAFLQSIGKEVNIVIGKFSKGDPEIILIKDTNCDGKVESVVHWYTDRNVISFEPHPEQYCSEEHFRNMKEDIFMGHQNDLSPNPDGYPYLQSLLEKGEDIRRWHNGFLVTKYDPDDNKSERLKFSYSDNGINGADLVFKLMFIDHGVAKMKPVISESIYCRGSKDPFVLEKVKILSAETIKKYRE